MRPAILLGFLVAYCEVFAQAPPDLAEILKRVGETYRAVKEYELISTSTGTAVPGRFLVAVRAPNRYRMEGADPNLDNSDGTFDQMVLVYDSASVWLFHPKANEYATFMGNDLTGDLSPEAVDAFAIGRFRLAADLAGSARFLRAEVIEMNGAKVDCNVLTVPVSIPKEGTTNHTWWIEKKSNHIVREDHNGSSVVFTTIKLNESLPDDLFKFKPPPGARRMGN
jgi:outer membrane lipoprotein-sorting protein